MKICYIADAGKIHTQRWVKYFADRGHEVHLISPSPLGDGDIGRAELHVLKRFPLQVRIISFPINLLSDIIQTSRLIKKIKPDILHAHYVTECGFLGALSGFHPFVLTAWGSDILIDPERYAFLKTFTKYVLKKAELITCDAEHVVEKLIRLGTKEEKIELIYFGVDTQKFNPEQRDEKLREELGVSNSPVIISARTLKPIYDVESLINAIPLVLKEIPDAKFIIAGDGNQRSYLEKLASSLGVSSSVRFVGWVPNDELPKYVASMDIYVSTSLSDAGLASSTAEAMACGLPVVITDFGDNRKWVEDSINGFIVSLRDPETLASKIIYLLRNEDDRIRFGQANRQIIEERSNHEKEMRKVEKIYGELIGRYEK